VPKFFAAMPYDSLPPRRHPTMAATTSQIEAALPALDSPMRRRQDSGMKKLAVILFLAFSVLKANASSQWMWHGAFPWVYSHAESSWWYMKAGADGKLNRLETNFYKNGKQKSEINYKNGEKHGLVILLVRKRTEEFS
jgi:hypothetical protein